MIQINPRGTILTHSLLLERFGALAERLSSVQEEPVITTEYTPAEVKEPQELFFLGMQKEPEDEQLAHFLAALKELQVNISFIEVLDKKTPYTACLKGILFEKKELRGDKIEVLIHDSEIVQIDKIPPASAPVIVK